MPTKVEIVAGEKIIHHLDARNCLACKLSKEYGKPYPKVHTHPIWKASA